MAVFYLNLVTSLQKHAQKLKVIQSSALRIILGACNTSPITSLEIEAHIPPLEIRFDYLFLKWYLKILHCPKGTSGNEICHEVGVPEHNFVNSYFSARARSLLTGLVVPGFKRTQQPIFHPSLYILTWNLAFSFPSKAPAATMPPQALTEVCSTNTDTIIFHLMCTFTLMEAGPCPYSHRIRTLCNTQGLGVPMLGSKTQLRKYPAVNRFPVSIACNQ
jgi:hypothetical protein